MASGLVMCRINRPNIWLHRPAKITKKYPCQNGAVHIWPLPEVRRSAAYGGKADGFERRATAPFDPERTSVSTIDNQYLQSIERHAFAGLP